MLVPAAPARARTPPRPNPRATRKEKTVAKAAETGVRPQKAPRLEPCRGCCYPSAVEDQADSVAAKIKSRNQVPMCEHCWLETFGRTTSGGSREDPRKQQRDRPRALIMACLECKRCLCAGVGVAITDYNPCGHAWFHARKKGHWVALWFDQPDEAYCFLCGSVWFLNCSDGENEVLEPAVEDESGAQASRPDTDQLSYVIRGIPNCGNTCYVNALVQCLLALDKMRTWMLGPNAPMRSLGVALKELFVDTTPGNDAVAKLNTKKLMEILGTLNARYAGTTMEDSHELLLDMCKGLNEEEKLQWPPKVRDRLPTVVDSIFRGQICSTLTCKWCLFDSPTRDSFSELSLALPSKGQTTKSVGSPQRSLAIGESNLRKFQTDAMDKDKASGSVKTDSTKGEQVCQKENNVHGILQTQENNISCSELSLEVIEVPHKTARVGDLFLLSQQEILAEANENTSTVQFTPEDKGKALSRNFICGYEDINSLASIEHCLAFNFKVEEVEWHCDNCAKVSEETGSGRPVKGSVSSSTTNEESDHDGKAEKRIDMSIVHDSQSASIPPNRRKQIDLNIADQMREDQNEQEDRKGHADMSIVRDSQNASIPPNRRKQIDLNIAYQMREDQNEEEDRMGHADMSIVHDSQNASIPPNRRKQIDLNIAYQMREDQNEQEDRKGHAYKAVVISKLPPVLTVHLKRFETVNDNQIKVPGHVSFDENLDVGQVMDPRSEDKDNSSYRLSGVIEHIGDSLHSGHNVAYVRASTIGSGSSLWFRASDDHISQVSLEEVLKCEAYVLFYERMEG